MWLISLPFNSVLHGIFISCCYFYYFASDLFPGCSYRHLTTSQSSGFKTESYYTCTLLLQGRQGGFFAPDELHADYSSLLSWNPGDEPPCCIYMDPPHKCDHCQANLTTFAFPPLFLAICHLNVPQFPHFQFKPKTVP